MSLNQVNLNNGNNLNALGKYLPAVNFKDVFSDNLTSANVTLNSGDVTTPSLNFSLDSDTGLYSSAVNEVSITCGGVQKLQVKQNWSPLTDFRSGSFTPTFSAGFTANLTQPDISWMRVNNTVYLQISMNVLNVSGSAQTACAITNLPVDVRPTSAKTALISCAANTNVNLSGISQCVVSGASLTVNFNAVKNIVSLNGQVANGSSFVSDNSVISYSL